MNKTFMAAVMELLFSPQEMKHLPSSGGVNEHAVQRHRDPKKKKKRRKMARDSRRRNRG